MHSRRVFLRLGVAVGALLTCAPLLGLLGLIRVFGALGKSGISDPRQLSHAVAETLFTTAGGLCLLPFGIVLVVICLSLLKRPRIPVPPPLPRFPENFGNPKHSD